MLVEFWTYSKRYNSTSLPSGDGTEKECYLKEVSSVLSPLLELQTEFNPSAWNYCYIPDFSRYYYIDNWDYFRGVWRGSCRVDVLGSWKTYISNTSALVIFSSSDYNLSIMDNRIASTADYDRQVTSAPFAGALTSGQQLQPGGYFALTCISGGSVWATGGTTTYFLDYQAMQGVAQFLGTEDLWESLQQFFTDPVNGIIDCYYLPIDVSQYIDLTTPQVVKIGQYSFGEVTGKLAQATNLAVKSKHATIEIPWGYDDFRRMSPYSEVTLFVPFCGSKSLPTDQLSDVENILVDYSVDVSTGAVQAIAYVKQEVMGEFSGNIRVNLPIGQTQARVDSILGGAAGTVTALGGAASGNPIALGAGLISAVSSVVSPSTYNICGGFGGSVLGTILGNDVGRWQGFRLACTSRQTTDSPENMRPIVGNALYKVRQINGLTGFCQTSGFSVAAPCTAQERQEINALMDGGVYL